jgi:hypothetical protein
MLGALGYKNAVTCDVPDDLRENPSLALLDLNKAGIYDFLDTRVERFSFKSHSLPPRKQLPSNSKVINILRDPRDLLVSWVFYLAELPVDWGGAPELKPLPTRDRLLTTLQGDRNSRTHNRRNASECDLYAAWFDYKCDILVKYEDLLMDGSAELSKISKSLGLDISDSDLSNIVAGHNFQKMKKNSELGPVEFFRKGSSGDWRNYFDSELIQAFKASNGGLWNDLTVRAGYEADLNW